jgi:hypothetical protein
MGDSIDFRGSSCYCMTSHKTWYTRKGARSITAPVNCHVGYYGMFLHLKDSRLIYDLK